VEVQCGTETGPAPAGQGATSAEYRAYPSEEQRRPAGCRAGRMPAGLSTRIARVRGFFCRNSRVRCRNPAHHHDISCTGAPRRASTSVFSRPALVTARTADRQRSPQCSRFCNPGRSRTRRKPGEPDEKRPDPTDPSDCAALAQPLHKHRTDSAVAQRLLSLKHPSVASALQDAGRCLAAVRSPTAECGYLVSAPVALD
jgi:hypothetical protein